MTGALTTDALRARLDGLSPVRTFGRLTRIVGLEVEARGLSGAIGDLVYLSGRDGRVPAEVVAVREDTLVVMPYGPLDGLAPDAPVEAAGRRFQLQAGPGLVGRVVDGLGRPIDGLGPVGGEWVDLDAPVPHPMRRQRIDTPRQRSR